MTASRITWRKTSSKVDEQVNLPLPGWKNITNKKRPLCIRIFWIAAVLVSIVACSFQIIERIQHFKKSKVSVALDVDVDAQLPIPNVVICPGGFKEMIDACISPDKDVKTGKPPKFKCEMKSHEELEEKWHKLRRLNQSLITSILKDAFKWTEDIYKITYRNSLMGTCLIFHFEKPLNMTLAALAEIRFPRAYWLSVTLHESEIVNDYDLLQGSVVGTNAGYLQFSISVRNQYELNLTENTCGDNELFHDCRRNCIDNIITKINHTCWLPFLNESLNLTKCESFEDIQKSLGEIDARLQYFDWEECDCLTPCTSTLFESTHYSFNTMNSSGEFTVNINFQNSQLQSIREYQGYTQVSLVCDLGGTVALFLGFCLLTILEIFDAMFLSAKTNEISSEIHSKEAWAQIKQKNGPMTLKSFSPSRYE